MLIKRNNLTAVSKTISSQTISETPDIRADVVSRGKALVANPNYPSRQQLQAVATLLAKNWNGALASSAFEEGFSNVRTVRNSSENVMWDGKCRGRNNRLHC